MANYANLKAAIDAVIKANGQQEITGPLLNQVLKAMVNALGAGYLFMGIAEHDTNPNTPDQNVFYIALEEGTYTHFGNAQVPFGISLLFWYGQWSVYNLVTFSNEVTNEVEEIPTSYAVFNALKDAAVYDVTEHSGQRFANLNSLLSSPDIDTLIPQSVRKAGMTIMFTSPAHPVQQTSQLFKHKFFFNAVDMSLFTDINRWIGIETTVTQYSLNVPTSGAVFASINTAKAETIAEAGVFDVTANNDGATFDSLSALLNSPDLETLIPVARRRGGMSIKYVQTSDNKYVQYRLMDDNFSTTPSDWQGVDDEPTAGSENLVTSSGIYNTLRLGDCVNITALKNVGGYTTTPLVLSDLNDAENNILYLFINPNTQPENAPTNITLPYGYYVFTMYNDYDTSTHFKRQYIVNYYDCTILAIRNWINGVWDESWAVTIDNVPTQNSNNLVKSGGVYKAIENAGNVKWNTVKTVVNNLKIYSFDNVPYVAGLLNSDGSVEQVSNMKTSDYILLDGYSYLKYINIFPKSGSYVGLCFYNESKTFIPYDNLPTYTPNNGVINLSDVPNVKYVRFSLHWTTMTEFNKICFLLLNTENDFNVFYNPELMEEIVEKTENIAEIGNFDNGIYGDLSSNVPISSIDNDSIYSTANSQSSMSGIIKSITVCTNTSGTLVGYVGLLDQRDYLVNYRKFEFEVPSTGLQTIDISDKNIYIETGEQLCIQNKTATLLYKTLTSAIEHQTIGTYGDYFHLISFEEQAPTAFPYGISIRLSYEVSTYDGRFAQKSDVSPLATQVNSLSEQLNNVGIVYDSSGFPYRIVVVGNQLVPKSLVYKKVVALGNSLTAHQDYPSIGWLSGGDYSMASTRIEVSWTNQLQKILRTVAGNSNAVVTPYNIYSWERNPAIEPATIQDSHGTYLSNVLTQDIDCIIFRAGENDAATTQTQIDYENGLTSLINYIKQLCPTADIVITSMMWPNTLKDTAFYNVANTMGLKYINSGNVGNNRESLGDYCLNVDNTTYFPIINSGIAGHVNDYGFYQFANILADSFGLLQLEEVYDIEVHSDVEYYINRTKGVYQGLITIQTFGNSQPTVNIVDSDSTSISVTHFDMSGVSLPSSMTNRPTWCSVFEMPNSDVTITIE